GDPARLVQPEVVQQPHDQGGPQVRLVLDEGIGQRQLGGSRLRNPGGELAAGPQREVHALVKIVPHQVVGGAAVEEDGGIVVAGQAGGLQPGGRDPLGAVQPENLLHQVDRPVQVV